MSKEIRVKCPVCSTVHYVGGEIPRWSRCLECDFQIDLRKVGVSEEAADE